MIAYDVLGFGTKRENEESEKCIPLEKMVHCSAYGADGLEKMIWQRFPRRHKAYGHFEIDTASDYAMADEAYNIQDEKGVSRSWHLSRALWGSDPLCIDPEGNLVVINTKD